MQSSNEPWKQTYEMQSSNAVFFFQMNLWNAIFKTYEMQSSSLSFFHVGYNCKIASNEPWHRYKKVNRQKQKRSRGYYLSYAGRDNCKQRQDTSQDIELQISHGCNPNTQK